MQSIYIYRSIGIVNKKNNRLNKIPVDISILAGLKGDVPLNFGDVHEDNSSINLQEFQNFVN